MNYFDSRSQQHDPLRRRTSLQSSSGQELNILKREDSNFALATPPRTPLTAKPGSDQKPPFFENRAKAEALQSGSYGSAGTGIRNRAYTISGPSPRSRASRLSAMAGVTGSSVSSSGSFSSKTGHVYDQQGPSSVSGSKMERVTGISPQFVFLTLYHSQCLGNIPLTEKPMLVNTSNKSIESSMKILDRIYP